MTRMYDKPLHQPVLFNRDVLYEMEVRPPPPSPHPGSSAAQKCQPKPSAETVRRNRQPKPSAKPVSRTATAHLSARPRCAQERWPQEFQRTRRSKVRSAEEVELNFLYHHYLRLQRFPVRGANGGRARFLFIQDCVDKKGRQRCADALGNRRFNFVCFNDGASPDKDLNLGAAAVRSILRSRFRKCHVE